MGDLYIWQPLLAARPDMEEYFPLAAEPEVVDAAPAPVVEAVVAAIEAPAPAAPPVDAAPAPAPVIPPLLEGDPNRLTMIVEAIGALRPEDYRKSKPKVTALEAVLGFQISEKERDAAMEEMKKAGK